MLFRRRSDSISGANLGTRVTDRRDGGSPTSGDHHTSRSALATDNRKSPPITTRSFSGLPQPSHIQSAPRRRSNIVRKPPRKCPDLSAVDLEKVVTDRIDSWTRMFTDPCVSRTQQSLVTVPEIPILLDPDDSTLIEWGSNLDFTELINTLPTD